MRAILMTSLCLLLFSPATTLAQDDDSTESRYVHFETNRGDIYLELYPEKAPVTVENFLAYVDSGFYDGTIFHRVIPGFMAQGGGFTADLQKKETREPIANEADNMLANDRGTIAMARTMDPDSATAQFFINVADNAALNHTGRTHSRAWGYAVFGQVVEGMDVVDEIVSTPTGSGGPFRSDVPIEPMLIRKAAVVESLPVPAAAAESETESENPDEGESS